MIGPSSSAADLIAHLQTLRSEDGIAGMARFGIVTGQALGISNPQLRSIARLARKDHPRALALWQSGIREARLLALMTSEPKRLTADEAKAFARGQALGMLADRHCGNLDLPVVRLATEMGGIPQPQRAADGEGASEGGTGGNGIAGQQSGQFFLADAHAQVLALDLQFHGDMS